MGTNVEQSRVKSRQPPFISRSASFSNFRPTSHTLSRSPIHSHAHTHPHTPDSIKFDLTNLVCYRLVLFELHEIEVFVFVYTILQTTNKVSTRCTHPRLQLGFLPFSLRSRKVRRVLIITGRRGGERWHSLKLSSTVSLFSLFPLTRLLIANMV